MGSNSRLVFCVFVKEKKPVSIKFSFSRTFSLATLSGPEGYPTRVDP